MNELQVHPETARERGLKPGDLARVTTSHGTLDLPVALNPGLRPDTLFMPFHWEASANLLTSAERLDPHSRMPAFKATPATLMPVPVSVPEAQPARIAPLEGGVPI